MPFDSLSLPLRSSNQVRNDFNATISVLLLTTVLPSMLFSIRKNPTVITRNWCRCRAAGFRFITGIMYWSYSSVGVYAAKWTICNACDGQCGSMLANGKLNTCPFVHVEERKKENEEKNRLFFSRNLPHPRFGDQSHQRQCQRMCTFLSEVPLFVQSLSFLRNRILMEKKLRKSCC